MERICAGIFGPLAMLGAIVHGFLHGADAGEILLHSWFCLVGFSLLGLLLGAVGERVIKESIEQRLKEELGRRNLSEKHAGSL